MYSALQHIHSCWWLALRQCLFLQDVTTESTNWKPQDVTAGAAGEPVGVLLAGKTGAAREALQDPSVAGLAQFGYPVSACMEALQRLKGDPDAAHRDLFARLTGLTLSFATWVCSI